jgi:cell division protein FtsB
VSIEQMAQEEIAARLMWLRRTLEESEQELDAQRARTRVLEHRIQNMRQRIDNLEKVKHANHVS